MAKPPVYELRMGLIKASIWENHNKQGTNYVVTVIRLFKNGTEWKESTRYYRDDLLIVAKLLDQAHSWIFRTQQSQQGTGQRGKAFANERTNNERQQTSSV